MKLTPTDLHKLTVFNNFFDFFTTALGPKQQLHGCQYTQQNASFPAFNSVLETPHNAALLDQLIPDIVESYRSKNLPCCWWVIEGLSSATLADNLLAFGFKKKTAFSGMYFDLSEPVEIPSHLSHIQVKPLNEKKDFSKVNKIIQEAFEMDPKSAALYQTTFEKLFDDERFSHYFIEENCTMVACGTIFIQNGVSGFYNLAVLPEYRNQSYGLAMQWHRLKTSQRLGAKECILQASEMAYKLDLEVGFKPIMQFTPYILLAE